MNDISLHSTSYTAQNVILDLASADPSIITILREESARVLKEAGGKWTRQAVTKLRLIDSTIRESMRMTPFNSIGLPRTVSIITLIDLIPDTWTYKTKAYSLKHMTRLFTHMESQWSKISQL